MRTAAFSTCSERILRPDSREGGSGRRSVQNPPPCSPGRPTQRAGSRAARPCVRLCTIPLTPPTEPRRPSETLTAESANNSRFRSFASQTRSPPPSSPECPADRKSFCPVFRGAQPQPEAPLPLPSARSARSAQAQCGSGGAVGGE